MKLAKLPKIGDIVKFKRQYSFYGGPHDYTNEHIEIEKGTLAEVVDRDFYNSSSGISDAMTCMLALAIVVNGDLSIFRFNYLIHKDLIEILEPSKALKLLYET
jgi:hypothetical protein